MHIQLFDAVKDNVVQKVRNPFLGTLIIVWIFHNYSNLYGLIFSSYHKTFCEKMVYLDNLFSPLTFIGNLIICILVSLIVLIVTYILLTLSRFIVDSYENIILPVVKKWTKGKIYTEEAYESICIERDNTQKKYEGERERRLRAEEEIEELESTIKNLKNLQNPQKIVNEKLVERNEDEDNLNGNQKIHKLLAQKGYLNAFEEMIYAIETNTAISNSEANRFFVTIGLAEINGDYGGAKSYRFTDSGKAFKSFYKDEILGMSNNN